MSRILRVTEDTLPASAPSRTQVFVPDGAGGFNLYMGNTSDVPVPAGKRQFAIESIDDGDSPYDASVSKANNTVILVDASSNPVIINLPSAVGALDRAFTIKKTDDAMNDVTISSDGAETIDGTSDKVLNEENEVITIVSDDTAWYVINHSFGTTLTS